MNLLSDCCAADVVEDVKSSIRDHHDTIEIYRCTECGNECDADEADEEVMKMDEMSLDDGREKRAAQVEELGLSQKNIFNRMFVNGR